MDPIGIMLLVSIFVESLLQATVFLLDVFCVRFLYSFVQGLFGGAFVKKALNLMLLCLSAGKH